MRIAPIQYKGRIGRRPPNLRLTKEQSESLAKQLASGFIQEEAKQLEKRAKEHEILIREGGEK